MADEQQNYQQMIAQMRQERAVRDHAERLKNIQVDYAEAIQRRDDAAAAGDMENFELADMDAEQLEKDYAYHNPPPPLRNPTQGGHGFRGKADSIPMIADSR
jgi:hypothetical protein